MFLINIDHIGIAVRELDATLAEYYRQYRVEPMHREVVESQGVEEAMIAVGGSHIQLLQPLSEESPVGKFIASRGEGLHHVAYAVADLDAALEHLRGEDVRLIDEEPRIGGGGSRIAFVHPRSLAGTLIELVESA